MARHLGRVKATRSRSRLGDQASDAAVERDARVTRRAALVVQRLPGVLLLILGVLMLRHLLVADRFVVSAVEVTGTRLLAPDEVRANTGLLGKSIFAVHESSVERTLLDRYACVTDVRVNCRLPSRCKVQVAEVGQVVVWEQDGQAWWVALDGQVLGAVTSATDAPTLRNSGAQIAPQEGYLVGVPWRYAYEAGRVLGEGQQLEFVSGYGLMVRLDEGQLPVYLGTEGDVGAKLALATDVLAAAEEQGLSLAYIDLRSATRPIVGGL